MKKITLLMAAFLMAVGMNAQIFEENFSSGVFPPDGWTLNQTNPIETWEENDFANFEGSIVEPVSGDFYAWCYWNADSNQDEELITPSIDLSFASNASLSFHFNGMYDWSVAPNDNCDLFVKISVNGGDFVQVWTETDHPDFTSEAANFLWHEVVLDLEDYLGEDDVRIMFNYSGIDGAHFAIDQVVVDGDLSVSQNEIHGFNYFFSPQTQDLTINANTAFSGIEIFNVLGQQVINKNLSSTSEVINLSSLKSGVYIASTVANGKTTTFKIVKR